MVFGFSFAFSQHFHARVIDEQMQAIGIGLTGNTHLQMLLAGVPLHIT
jgi:hypothetical protein